MGDNNVVSVFGGPVGFREPNLALIDALEGYLLAARSGEIIGGAFGFLRHDGSGERGLVGAVGGYSLIGAIDIVRAELVEIVLEVD